MATARTAATTQARANRDAAKDARLLQQSGELGMVHELSDQHLHRRRERLGCLRARPLCRRCAAAAHVEHGARAEAVFARDAQGAPVQRCGGGVDRPVTPPGVVIDLVWITREGDWGAT